MSTVVEPIVEAEPRFLIRNLDWSAYEKISEALTGSHVRLTYDRGNLELMTISLGHGRLSRLFAQLVQVLTREHGLGRLSCGDVTCKRRDLDRGLEPDECYYIANEAVMRGKDELDLTVDPPPDLAIEIELTSPLRSRRAIYEDLGVPELWRFDGKTVTALVLGESGYETSQRSRSFPGLVVAELQRFVEASASTDEDTVIDSFRDWVNEHVVGGR